MDYLNKFDSKYIYSFFLYQYIMNSVQNKTTDNKILVRDMKGKALIDGSVRVTIGTTSQMREFWEKFISIAIVFICTCRHFRFQFAISTKFYFLERLQF